LPPAQQYTVTYTPCPPVVGDASDDANADASESDATADAAETDASSDASSQTCYASCSVACEALKPTENGGASAECISETDGGSVGSEHMAQCQTLNICGRRLDGLVDPRVSNATALGETLARAAWLEAASIHAFRRLARELRAHRAPDSLVRAARACAWDEARHARAMARLAKRHGAVIPRVVVGDCGVRDLEAVARENAVEACIGETYGALLASWQADHAKDAEVQEVMRSIAPDELRHAAVGWAVAAWAEPRLSDDAKARVCQAREQAVRDLLRNTQHFEPNAAVTHATGAPCAAHALALASGLFA
jgi:hypothetical protein